MFTLLHFCAPSKFVLLIMLYSKCRGVSRPEKMHKFAAFLDCLLDILTSDGMHYRIFPDFAELLESTEKQPNSPEILPILRDFQDKTACCGLDDFAREKSKNGTFLLGSRGKTRIFSIGLLPRRSAGRAQILCEALPAISVPKIGKIYRNWQLNTSFWDKNRFKKYRFIRRFFNRKRWDVAKPPKNYLKKCAGLTIAKSRRYQYTRCTKDV